MIEVHPHSLQAWILAARPKTLSGAIVPVCIGTAWAIAAGSFQLLPALLCLQFAVWMQIAANFMNDLIDHKKGSDTALRLGPERACAQGWIAPSAMQKAIYIVLSMAILTGLLLVYWAGWKLLLIGLLCVLFAYLYTGGPYPLAYHGWGDVLVLVFFGLIPVGGTYYVQTQALTFDVLLSGLSCGCLIDSLLVVNNYRDRAEDALSNKRTLVVRLGERFGSYLYLTTGLLAALLCIYYGLQERWYTALLPQIFVPFHIYTWIKMNRIYQGKLLNLILGETSRNMIGMGLLLSLGIVLDTWLR